LEIDLQFHMDPEVENLAMANKSIVFRCELCNIQFDSKLELAGHTVGKHRQQKCSICKETFDNGGKLGHHKIQAHGYTAKQLGWGLPGGWNRGMTQLEAFNVTGNVHHGNAEFMNKLNTPEYLKIKKLSRAHHEDVVIQKEKELRAQGYRTFCTSNYSRHKRVPDIIAVSPEGKVVAVEMESVKPYKSSQEAIRRKYSNLLMQEEFFDKVMVEFFPSPKFNTEDSNIVK
jgi:hypothetical protein